MKEFSQILSYILVITLTLFMCAPLPATADVTSTPPSDQTMEFDSVEVAGEAVLYGSSTSQALNANLNANLSWSITDPVALDPNDDPSMIELHVQLYKGSLHSSTFVSETVFDDYVSSGTSTFSFDAAGNYYVAIYNFDGWGDKEHYKNWFNQGSGGVNVEAPFAWGIHAFSVTEAVATSSATSSATSTPPQSDPDPDPSPQSQSIIRVGVGSGSYSSGSSSGGSGIATGSGVKSIKGVSVDIELELLIQKLILVTGNFISALPPSMTASQRQIATTFLAGVSQVFVGYLEFKQ